VRFLSGYKRITSLIALPIILLAIVGHFMVSVIFDYDAQLQKEQIRFLQAGMDHVLYDSQMLIREMTDWDEAVEKVIRQPDPAFIEKNLKDYLTRVYHYDAMMVLDGTDTILFKYDTSALNRQTLKIVRNHPTVKALSHAVRQTDPMNYTPRADWIVVSDHLYEVSVGAYTLSRFKTPERPKARMKGVEDHVLILLRRVDQEFLTVLADQYGLPLLQTQQQNPDRLAVPLKDHLGQKVGSVYLAETRQDVLSLLARYVVFALLIIAGVIGVAVIVFRQNQAYHTANMELNRLNTRMDDLVRTRTRDLRTALSEAQKANKAKASFLSSMTHEFRTPLNSILGFTQLLMAQKKPNLTPTEQQWLDQIDKSGALMLSLVDDVLELAHLESETFSFDWELLHPREVFVQCYEAMNPIAAERNITLTGTPQAEKFIRADRRRMHQVLMNLMQNAVKYNRDGGQVSFGCMMRGSDMLRLYVRDTGVGIAPEEQARVFEPFYRGEQVLHTIEGTGVGLTVVKRMTEAMGGLLTLESRLGEGTSVFLDFPAYDKPEE